MLRVIEPFRRVHERSIVTTELDQTARVDLDSLTRTVPRPVGGIVERLEA